MRGCHWPQAADGEKHGANERNTSDDTEAKGGESSRRGTAGDMEGPRGRQSGGWGEGREIPASDQVATSRCDA